MVAHPAQAAQNALAPQTSRPSSRTCIRPTVRELHDHPRTLHTTLETHRCSPSSPLCHRVIRPHPRHPRQATPGLDASGGFGGDLGFLLLLTPACSRRAITAVEESVGKLSCARGEATCAPPVRRWGRCAMGADELPAPASARKPATRQRFTLRRTPAHTCGRTSWLVRSRHATDVLMAGNDWRGAQGACRVRRWTRQC
jgi:hypothetical protein